ncbi:MAG TPA: sugar phosphate nucleotidyltransferase [Gemmataceae bacterium]|jgi:UTP--glucose-1-phosphate uridylyltransferase|nr:sugar phosphate nucleotidyltransferase [Gemmataceae bacterium]
MEIRQAVITAAGRGHRTLPLQTFVDRGGVEKKALEIILAEAVDAGIDEVCVVVTPGDQAAYRDAAGPHARRLHFVEQTEPAGYGHALSLAREFVSGRPFLHLVSDHVYLSDTDETCARQVIEAARAAACTVTAVQATRESMLPYYGVYGGRRVGRRTDLYEVDTILEKPTPSEAEQRLIVPGLRAGYYLCSFGMHAFTPAVMDLLVERVAADGPGVTLAAVLAELAKRERYLALEVRGRRYNTGVKLGLLYAQLALALGGADREDVLAGLVELLAQDRRGPNKGAGK